MRKPPVAPKLHASLSPEEHNRRIKAYQDALDRYYDPPTVMDISDEGLAEACKPRKPA